MSTLNPDSEAVYLDYNATTPPDPAVLETMFFVLREVFGNPSSQSHRWGRAAQDCVEAARGQTAALIDASPSEIVFTSGATESCNLAIKGAAAAYRDKGSHIIASMAEHKAVLEPLKQLANSEIDITLLRPDRNGRITAEQVQQAIGPHTILVCVMAANNVLGTVNPIAEIAEVCKKRGVLLFCDATQAVGKIPFSVEHSGVDLAALSAHKMYGPKGVGALYVRSRGPRVRLTPQILGGGQERGLRGGTQNVPGIVGMGKACELAARQQMHDATYMRRLRDRFEDGLAAAVEGVEVAARFAERLPNTSLIVFPRIRAEQMLRRLADTVAASTGSACDSAAGQSNYVLKAIGMEQDKIAGAVRFSIGRFTTDLQIDFAVKAIGQTVRGLNERR